MKTIHLIAAARPNFMKIAPLYHALVREDWAKPVIVHTGQHYDLNMSDAFFTDLGLPVPDLNLGVGSGGHAEQTGRVMMTYEKVLLEQRPDLVVVVGDVNSTMACTIAAVKLGVRTAHLEAGLRSFDRTMPEEINRIVTDSVADILWTPSEDGDKNLKTEGVAPEKIVRVGNIMIDSLELMRNRIEADKACKDLGVDPGSYGLITLHRPANVDDENSLKNICRSFRKILERLPLIFPLHPRTRKNLNAFGLMTELEKIDGLHLHEPQPYVRFMNLLFKSRLLITDSGGIQEETTYLGIPCLTLRPNTERPVTVTRGTNQLTTIDDLPSKVEDVLNGYRVKRPSIAFWDGKTAGRVVASIKEFLR